MNLEIFKNEEVAEIIGLTFGDGGLTKGRAKNSSRFQLRGHLIEDRDHYDDYIIPIFNKSIMRKIYNRDVGIVQNKNKRFYGISTENEKIGVILNFLGMKIGIKKEMSIPYWIKSNRKFVKAFLRGFLDTDGSIYCQRNYSIKKNKLHTQIKISMGCCSKTLMEEIKSLLKEFQFPTILKVSYEEKNQRSKQDYYKVVVDGNINVERWFKLIGSKNPKHITKFQVWKKYGFCPPKTTLEQRRKMLNGKLNPLSFYT